MSEFSNKPLLLAELPPTSIALPEYQALAPQYLLVKRIRFGIYFLVLTALFAAFLYWGLYPKAGWKLTLAAALLWLLLALFYWLNDVWSFRASGYALREQDLHYQTGWWWRKLRVVSFNRIQHLSLDSEFIERKYGLASLAIYTAGAGQADFKIRGLRRETALQIKELIGQKIHINQDEDSSAAISEENE